MQPFKLKLTKQDFKKLEKLLNNCCEIGGMIDISNNGKMDIITYKKGKSYKLKYKIDNFDCEIFYHTHAYMRQMKDRSIVTISNKIFDMLDNGHTDKALLLFETDIIRIHPPSPQDCMNVLRYTNSSIAFLVIAQEKLYLLKATNRIKTQNHTELLKKLEHAYFTHLWGIQKNSINMSSLPKIKHTIKKCIHHTQEYSTSKRIHNYKHAIEALGFDLLVLPWHVEYTYSF